MLGSFRVEGDDIGAGLGEIGNDAINRLDHQMHVNRRRSARANGFANQRPNRQIGHIMVVHHVKVNPVGARGDDVGHLLAQLGEVGRKQARCDDEIFG